MVVCTTEVEDVAITDATKTFSCKLSCKIDNKQEKSVLHCNHRSTIHQGRLDKI